MTVFSLLFQLIGLRSLLGQVYKPSAILTFFSGHSDVYRDFQRWSVVNRASDVLNAFCPICQTKLTKANDQFCTSHQTAFKNIQDAYWQWANAYGSLTKEEYLRCVSENEKSGEWVIEVARYLLEKGNIETL
jgi:hypothetical protein